MYRVFDSLRIHALFLTVALTICQAFLSAQDDVGGEHADKEPKADSAAPATLDYSRWSGEVNVPDPVAISFDNNGRAYVTQTTRRKIQDLDIRQHQSWIPDDVGFQSVEDKRNFYHRVLAPSADGRPAKSEHVEDLNDDGSADWRDLTVISEKIHLVEDTDQDGTADRISLFADDFRTEVTGIAAGVLWYDDAVYTTIAPDVWKLRDTDGDDKADTREVIATGFGLHIAYAGHDMHGLTVGPDGKIYWTVGDKGISFTSKEGRRFHYPNQGGVMRCNSNGTDFEVFAHGLRNVQELAFDQFGNLFGVDNDADQLNERERIVYIVEGMDAGWRCNYQYRGNGYNPWTDEKLWVPWFDGQAAYITPTIGHSLNGPAGFAFNPGTALSPEYHDYFFLTGAPGGEQRAFQLKPKGASFDVANDHQIGQGVPLVGINFAPDGALYGVDWGGGYPLNEKGAIWKIDVPGAADLADRRETQQLIATGFRKVEIRKLVNLLSHADQRVRLGAQFELVDRVSVNELQAIAKNSDADLIPRVHSIWGTAQLVRYGNAKAILFAEFLKDQESEIRLQALRTISDFSAFDGNLIVPLLEDPDPRVRFHAAIALRNHTTSDALPALAKLASRLQPSDTYLRHAVAYGMSGVEHARLIADLATDDSVQVRIAAVIALRHRNQSASVSADNSLLGEFLQDDHPLVATEAARAIYERIAHMDFAKTEIPQDLIQLAGTLSTVPKAGEPLRRRSIGAAFLLGNKESAERLAVYALESDEPAELRVAALNALAEWQDPPLLDIVDGRRRNYPTSTRTTDTESIAGTFLYLNTDPDPKVRAVALKTSRQLKLRFSREQLEELAMLVTDQGSPDDVKVEALGILHSQSYSKLDKLIQTSIASESPAVRMRSLELLIDTPEAAINAINDVLANSTDLAEQQYAVEVLANLRTRTSDARLNQLFEEWSSGKVSPGIELELISAATNRSADHPGLADRLRSYNSARKERSKNDPIAAWSECLEGGNADSGRELFNTHLAAACIRCHRVGEEGSTVGPNLQGIALKRDAKHLLRAMIDPSADIEPNYQSLVLELVSGKSVQGLLIRETDEITVIADAQGKEVKIENDEIEDSYKDKTSIMPEIAKILSSSEIRDIVAYLRTLDTPIANEK